MIRRFALKLAFCDAKRLLIDKICRIGVFLTPHVFNLQASVGPQRDHTDAWVGSRLRAQATTNSLKASATCDHVEQGAPKESTQVPIYDPVVEATASIEADPSQQK